MGHDDGAGGTLRRVPHVLTTVEEVESAVALYKDRPNFVFDVETTRGGAERNELRWIGIGAEGLVHLIPTGHPLGPVDVPRHQTKTAAFFFYEGDDERRWTPSTRKLPLEQRRPSFQMKEHWKEATYLPPPDQLYPHEVLDLLRPLMFSDKGKVGHNVKFDVETIAKYYGEIPPGPYHDTLVLTHVLDEDRMSYDLKTLTGDWFKVPQAQRKAWYPNLGKEGTDNFGLDTVARYLAKDVRYAWLRFTDLLRRLEAKGLRQVYDFEMQVYPSIIGMEMAGFPVDLSKLQSVRADLEGQIAEIEGEAHLIAGDQFPLSNLDAKRWVLFGEGTRKNPAGQPIPVHGHHRRKLKSQNLRVRSRTEKSEVPQVTGAVLEYYADRGNRMADLLKTWAELEKLRGTFIEGIGGLLNPSQNGGLPTVHSTFHLHRTVTGRFSASSPNIHQLPREQKGRTSIRNLFVAGPGRRLIVADYDQIELRCAGYLSEDGEMVQVFIDGRDIHAEAAVAMYRIAQADVSSELRQVGKTQNFAVLYGAGEAKIAFVAGCTLDRAQELIRSYFQRFNQLEKWKFRELQLARKRGDRQNPWSDPPRVVIPPFGRLRRLPMLFELDREYIRFHAERQAINALCQGFAAYITKLAMVELHETLPKGATMIAQVHDEIIVIADDDVADEAERITKDVMEGVLDPTSGKPILGRVPLVVSAATGESWAAAKG